MSKVEAIALKNSLFKEIYRPTENIRTIVVDHFPALGKLTAMRFVEWVQANPGGVISLPTGKTPEHFIKWVHHLLSNWETSDVRQELENNGIDPGIKPDMQSLHFVQIDEFYPIKPTQHNSFFNYVNHYYINGLSLDPQKALLMDCTEIGLEEGMTLENVWPNSEVDLSLRYEQAKNSQQRRQKATLSRIDQWCQEYEQRIRKLGGIGFFLGGIGPDGHIGFNTRGSDHHSTTRLMQTNYETQAAAAGDLGGIEVSRKRLVITIGLGTITHNPECVAIIIAAGEAKARIVADSIQNEADVLYPATALHKLENARFYITKGAAKLMEERQLAIINHSPELSDEKIESIIIDLALKNKKSVSALSREDFRSDHCASAMLKKRHEKIETLTEQVHRSLESKLDKAVNIYKNTRFLHTEPHHDDLMLGYLPHIVRHVRDASNVHYFACLTSGFTAVTNTYMTKLLERLNYFMQKNKFDSLLKEGYFRADNINGRNRDVWQYLDGVAANSAGKKENGTSRRLLRNLMELQKSDDLGKIQQKVDELNDYFANCYPGQKDRQDVQTLKGMCREWEAECLWGYLGWSCEYVKHLRLGFYTGDIFTEEPTHLRDVPPILNLLHETRPDVLTVALDPEASGPDTHYKVLQAITEALRQYVDETGRTDIKIWGYRNVWYRFHPAEANIFVPVSLNMFAIMQNAFLNTFISQKDASFPSYEHDGPFSELAQKIQVEQYQHIKTCLGRERFYGTENPLILATRGLVYLKEMTLEEFYEKSRQLKKAAENR